MEQKALTKNQLLSQLSRSPHGDLNEYLPMVQAAAKQEPEFLARLIAWDRNKGQIRDAKVALPVASLSMAGYDTELAENSLAHIALLGPRELVRAYRFALKIRLSGFMQKMRRLVEQYLREKEAGRDWDRLAVQHRKTLKELYALAHVKPGSDYISVVLFGRDLAKVKQPLPANSVFATIANLKNMSPAEAAAAIVENRIPFLIAMGALGDKMKDSTLVMTLIDRMSPTELVTNTKLLERLGLKTDPALRAAYEKALERTARSGKNLLKTTRAAEAMDDEGLKTKLQAVQEKQIAAHKGVDGNWLVLGDKSGSMSSCIEVARHVSGTLAKFVKGEVHLVFFDTTPRHFDVTGKTYDEILKLTRMVDANGGTSIGCGISYALDKKFEVDGIAVVTDAAENTPPFFVDQYKRLCETLGKDIPVYLYLVATTMHSYSDQDLRASMKRAGLEMQEFNLTGKIDYYSLPNLVSTMNVSRYSVVDEIMETPLLTLADVFKKTDVRELTAV